MLVGISDSMPKQPSQLFEDLVRHSGSQSIECELCGRVYFSPTEGDWDEAELKELEEQARKEPDKYIKTDDYTPWGTIDGKQAVIGCKCGKLADYEKLFWDHRRIIIGYLTQRSEAELKEKQKQNEEAQKLKKLEK